MPFPGWSDTEIVGDLVSPQGPRLEPSNSCLEYGPVAVADLSEGLDNNTWQCFYSGGAVQIKNLTTGGAPVVLFSVPGVDHVSLTWDQLGRAIVAFLSAGTLKLYWYDPVAVDYVQTDLGASRIAFVHQPDRRQIQIDLGETEAVLAYQRGTKVYYRLQSERWENEYLSNVPESASLKLTNLAMNNLMRLQMDYEP